MHIFAYLYVAILFVWIPTTYFCHVEGLVFLLLCSFSVSVLFFCIFKSFERTQFIKANLLSYNYFDPDSIQIYAGVTGSWHVPLSFSLMVPC